MARVQWRRSLDCPRGGPPIRVSGRIRACRGSTRRWSWRCGPMRARGCGPCSAGPESRGVRARSLLLKGAAHEAMSGGPVPPGGASRPGHARQDGSRPVLRRLGGVAGRGYCALPGADRARRARRLTLAGRASQLGVRGHQAARYAKTTAASLVWTSSLARDPGDVVANRHRRDARPCRERGGREPLRHTSKDFGFAGCERGESALRVSVRGPRPIRYGGLELVLERRGFTLGLAQHVHERGKGGPGRRDREGRDREAALGAAGRGDIQIEPLDGVVRVRACLKGHRTARAAVHVAVRVAAAEDVVAPPAEDLVGGPPGQRSRSPCSRG